MALSSKPGTAQTHIPVVGIGVPENGLSVLLEFFAAVPANSGMAFVLAGPLLDANDDALVSLTGLLRLPVQDICTDQPVEADHLYCVPADRRLRLAGNLWRPAAPGSRESVDDLFVAMAEARGSGAIGILLGDVAQDLRAGMAAIQSAAGLMLVRTTLASYGADRPGKIVESASAMPFLIARHLGLSSFAQAALARPDTQKSRFLSFANHDLRQPLQTLQLLTSTIGRKTDDPAILRLVEKQGMVLDSMKHLLNSLIDLCRIEAGLITPDFSRHAVAEVLAQVVKEFSSAAQSRGIQLKVRFCAAMLQTDGQLLGKLIRQLVSNALRNTERGKVLLACRQRGECLRIEVWDTGQGLADDELARLRSVLARSGPPQEQVDGVDLSMTYVRHLAQLLQVDIQIRSQPGQGSWFAFEIPLRSAPGRRQPLPTRPKAVPYRGPADALVLLVADDPSLREAAGALLKKLGLQVLDAASEIEAFARLQDSGGQPDLIMADFRLAHGETGLEVIEGVRKMLEIKIPAILVTGDGLPPAADNLAARGYTIMNKPIDVDELVTHMNKALIS